jgi:hypothetical protein
MRTLRPSDHPRRARPARNAARRNFARGRLPAEAIGLISRNIIEDAALGAIGASRPTRALGHACFRSIPLRLSGSPSSASSIALPASPSASDPSELDPERDAGRRIGVAMEEATAVTNFRP